MSPTRQLFAGIVSYRSGSNATAQPQILLGACIPRRRGKGDSTGRAAARTVTGWPPDCCGRERALAVDGTKVFIDGEIFAVCKLDHGAFLFYGRAIQGYLRCAMSRSTCDDRQSYRCDRQTCHRHHQRGYSESPLTSCKPDTMPNFGLVRSIQRAIGARCRIKEIGQWDVEPLRFIDQRLVGE